MKKKNLIFYIVLFILGYIVCYLYIKNPLEKVYNFSSIGYLFAITSFFTVFLLRNYVFQKIFFGLIFMLLFGGYYFVLSIDKMQTIGLFLIIIYVTSCLVTFLFLKYKSKSLKC